MAEARPLSGVSPPPFPGPKRSFFSTSHLRASRVAGAHAGRPVDDHVVVALLHREVELAEELPLHHDEDLALLQRAREVGQAKQGVAAVAERDLALPHGWVARDGAIRGQCRSTRHTRM